MENETKSLIQTLWGSKQTKTKKIAYWVITVTCCWELAYGASWDLSRNSHVKETFTHLGYPYYLLTLLGSWKLAATITILIPRFGLLKEWAYAGCIFLFTGAAFSHISVGSAEDTTNATWCIVGTLLFISSWALRPTSRRFTVRPIS